MLFYLEQNESRCSKKKCNKIKENKIKENKKLYKYNFFINRKKFFQKSFFRVLLQNVKIKFYRNENNYSRI